MDMSARLEGLRQQMALHKVAAFLVPRTDEYQNEYVPACAERLLWLTGFSGSAGVAVVTEESAALFVDGRYTLQAPQEVDGAHYSILHISKEPPVEWLAGQLKRGQQVGYDAWLHPQAWVEKTQKHLAEYGIGLVAVDNLIDKVWADRPAPPLAKFEVHAAVFAGESAEAKRFRMAERLGKEGVDAFVLTAPDSIAWLLNIRGQDVPHTPLPLGFGILHVDGTVELFADERKITGEVQAHLGNSVRIVPIAQFGSRLAELAKTGRLAADESASAAWVFAQGKILPMADPCVLPKAMKNATEIEGTRRAHKRDGVALVRCLSWLAQQAPGSVDELTVSDKLEALRREGELFRDLSFDTIAGSGPNGAIVHYRSSPKTNRKLGAGELFLLDSGAQYSDGTTDVTRTMAIGVPSAEMKDRFTRVLKGHIAIASAVFPQGTTGHQIDVLARHALWQVGCDFGHGTGHGVGSYLSVHEGPQRISPRPTPMGTLEIGMIVSNEPGYYKAGAYGIRIENLVTVQPLDIPGAEQAMLGFETLTLCPIDRNLVDTSLLLPHERAWLNAYHTRVLRELGPLVKGSDAHWLEAATAPI